MLVNTSPKLTCPITQLAQTFSMMKEPINNFLIYANNCCALESACMMEIKQCKTWIGLACILQDTVWINSLQEKAYQVTIPFETMPIKNIAHHHFVRGQILHTIYCERLEW